MMPGFYNHNYQIVQTEDYLVIVVEMIHEARIVPLDGREHIDPTLRQWLGDSRGHWEGDTLVIETTNFNNKILARGGTVLGGDQHLRVVERLTRVSEDTVDYEITITNPTVWTEPWTVSTTVHGRKRVPTTSSGWSGASSTIGRRSSSTRPTAGCRR